jgi:prenyltransferase beta subunit
MHISRRAFVASVILFHSGAIFAKETGNLVTRETEQSIESGLTWLSKQIDPSGAFQGRGYAKNVAVCSLGGLAFLASGSTPGRGQYGSSLDKLIAYVSSCCQSNGFIHHAESSSHGPMYEHGFATLFLAEAYGMTQAINLRERVSLAVDLILSTQNAEGGWRYEPRRADADISVTICQIMALRAAKNAGFHVPNAAVEKCIAYVKKCQNADGGFMYMSQGSPSRFPRSAAGVVALLNAGIYHGSEIEKGLAYLEAHIPSESNTTIDPYELYGHYYAVQAMWQAGGKQWEKWYSAVRDYLIKQQLKNGSWRDGIGLEYGTAMACIILQMPNNYLPIFQR